MRPNYIKHKIVNLISITKIVTIHYHELSKDFCFNGESHNFWEMVYIDSGKVSISAGGKEHNLKQGEVIFHKPNEFHTLKTNGEIGATAVVVSFVCSSKAMSFFKEKTMVVPPKSRRYISAIIEEHFQTFKSMEKEDLKLELRENPLIGGQQMLKTSLEQLLITLIRSENDSSNIKIFPSRESMENHLISQIMQIIADNTYSSISVDIICRKLNYSRTYLSRIFKAATGHTILDYIIVNRIQEAKKLIREEKYSFTQISDLLVFNNPQYFSAVFKKYANMTPTDYKNSVIKG